MSMGVRLLPFHLDVLLEGEGAFVPAAGGALGVDAFPGEGDGGVGVGGVAVGSGVGEEELGGGVEASGAAGVDVVVAVVGGGVGIIAGLDGDATEGLAVLVGDGAVDVELGVGAAVFADGRVVAARDAEEAKDTGDEFAFGGENVLHGN